MQNYSDDTVRASSWQGQGKVKRQGQGKFNVRLKQSNHNHNHNYNLMGFNTIEINLVTFIDTLFSLLLKMHKTISTLTEILQNKVWLLLLDYSVISALKPITEIAIMRDQIWYWKIYLLPIPTTLSNSNDYQLSKQWLSSNKYNKLGLSWGSHRLNQFAWS